MTTKNYFKIPLLLMTIAILTSCSNNSDWNRFGLNGKVKTYLERKYEAEKKFGEWENGDREDYGNNRIFFDIEGNYQCAEYLDKDNGLLGKFIPQRENGEIIEEIYYNKDGKLINKIKNIHNSKDEFEFIVFNKDGEKTTQGKYYFVNNRCVKKEVQTFEEDKVKEEYSVVAEYDKKGHQISEKHTDKKGEITYFMKFKYIDFDKNNNWTKRFGYGSEEGEEPENIFIREYEYY